MTGHFNKGLKGKQESSTGPSFALRINLSKKNFLEQNLEEDDRRKSQAGGGGGGEDIFPFATCPVITVPSSSTGRIASCISTTGNLWLVVMIWEYLTLKLT